MNKVKRTPLKPWSIDAVVDGNRLRVQLSAAALDHLGDEKATRARVLDLLKGALFRGRLIAQERLESGAGGLDCAHLLAAVQDQVISALYDFTITHVFRARNPTAAERLSVCATGGYGRNSMAPSSDVDLMFVRPIKDAAWAESVIEYMLYMLWDMGLKVGHASRTISECLRAAREDMTIRTSVLETRFVCGDKLLFKELEIRLRKDLFDGTAADFVAAKLAERDNRHRRTGESRYMVEPNIKDGKGGLRDLHTLFWIAKYIHGTDDVSQFVDKGVFSREDMKQFNQAAEFLWTVRCHLHFLTGRAEERLTFDLQPEMARRMGYGDRADNPAVERFMKRYFLVTKQVGSLTRILSARLELDRQKAIPRGISRFFASPAKVRTLSDPRFLEDHGRIGFADPTTVSNDLSALIDIFKMADLLDLDIDPSALALTNRMASKGRAMREDPRCVASFLEIAASTKDPARALGLLNESGLLGRLVPEFGRIVGQTQFNMYHHFTVDEHTLRGIANISDIEHGRLAKELPVSTELFPRIANRRALYLAMLLHDVGKGEGDQQIEGAKAAQIACRRLGLDAEEVDLVAWLVGHHLIMSEVAQRRDIGDPKTISDFAATVGTLERLRLLLVLTVADIRAVGPGVWNDWKAQLLRDLYKLTEATLRGGRSDERFVRRQLKAQADERRAEALIDPILAAFFTSLEDAYWLGFDRDQQKWHGAEVAKALHQGADFWLASRPAPSRGATEVLVLSPDQPGLFAALSALFAQSGANVIDARIHTTKDGQAFDVFALQDQSGAAFGEGRSETIDRLFGRLRAVLQAEKKADRDNLIAAGVAATRKPTNRTAAFTIEPVIMVDNDGAAFDTIVEVSGRDRPGLLADLAKVFEEEGLNVTSAHIDGVGERATDAFYLRDRGGLKLLDARRIAVLKQRLMAVLAETDVVEGPSLSARRKLARARASIRR
ncbi:bifunctional uridylyltransferase/uridylyl-removing enzyme [Candidatus Phycosocius bacilliformis]|uniref:Bifunctional uridylyltransferase/uridylyl-removing enzyme n=1 Tax=Candidatus Phycosocius bacilliformis TaxID=1445552 RepID=A0A2P2E628_9PROT|nr:[protein-PII] uridylyltransferase [Candidatus Phycosocius bacilliformis]GBF56510.1 bifunctional uridylyltransferase/uridylyl-removing enzyme [Candidatus Phycosocius bacilliformis]